MAKDITLKTRNGETRYPKSVTALIYENGTGKTLQTIIDEMRQVDTQTDTRTQHFKADVNNLDTLKNKTDIGLYNYVGTGWRGSVSVCYDSADNVSQVALSSSTPSYNGNTLAWLSAQPCAMARTYTNGAWSHWEKVGAPVVNDLTTGGTDKALSAEMGKTLKEGLDALGPKIDKLDNKTIKLSGIVAAAAELTDPQVGDIFWSTYLHQLRIILTVTPNLTTDEVVPDDASVFIYNDELYVISGNEMVFTGQRTEGRLDWTIVKVSAWGTTSGLSVGEVAYNTSKILRKKVGASSWVTIPYTDGLVVAYNNEFYKWNGSDLVLVNAALNDAVENKVDKKAGKNLYANNLSAGYFKTDGSVESSTTNSHTDDYMPVEPSTAYYLSRNGDDIICYGTYAYGVWYDESKNFISSFLCNQKSVTSPSNAKYLRVSVRNEYNNKIQIEKGSTRTTYQAYGCILGYIDDLPAGIFGKDKLDPQDIDDIPTSNSQNLVKSGGVAASIANVQSGMVKASSKNIYDGVIEGGYLLANGSVSDSSVNYHTANYLPVAPSTQYYASRKNDGAIAIGSVYICFYGIDKAFLSSQEFTNSPFKSFTTPANCYYIRTTIRLEYNDEVQIEAGNARTEYAPYNPLYGYLGDLRRLDKESKCVKSIVGSDASTSTADSLAANTSLTLSSFPNRLKKRLAISFTCKFSQFLSLSLGQGYKSFSGAGIKIDDTNVYAMDYDDGVETIRQTVAHGISDFSTYLSVALYVDAAQCAYVILTTVSATTRVKLTNFYYAHSGYVFARAEMAMTNVKLSATCADFRCPVWAFGDSYFGLSIVRVGYWLRENGYFNILFDGLGGDTATDAMAELKRCLNFGTPKYIVWALGMNGATDSNNQPNSTWLSLAQELIGICNDRGITPVFCTIPSVPSMVHEALSSWVRSSGYRYIDTADAVGSQSDGTWYAGMLSSDDVHPTEFGAKVIVNRWLTDFPEIMEYGIVSPSGEAALITI